MGDSTKVLLIHQHAIVGGAEGSITNWALRMPAPFRPVVVLGEEGSMADGLRRERIPVHVTPLPAVRPFRMPDIVRCVRILVRMARKEEVALIHSNTPRTNLLAGLAALWARLPVVWHARNLIYGKMRDTDRQFMFLATRVVCNSRAIEARFHRNGKRPEKVVTIHSGVDTTRFSPEVDGTSFRREMSLGRGQVAIAIVGRIGVGKGHEVFVRAAHNARQMGSRAHFLIVGGAQTDEEKGIESHIRQLARSLGLAGDLRFTGMRGNVPVVMAGLDVVALCTEAEPFARVLLEAMASRRAVVGTDTGGTPEIIEEGRTGRLFAPGDAEALGRIFLDLEKNRAERERLGRNARKACETKFSIERHVARMTRLYWESITGY